MSEPKTVAQLLTLAERVLGDSTHIFDDHDNRMEAEELLAMCLEIETEDLLESLEPSKRLRERYLALVTRRAGGEPLPFLTGFIEFYDLRLKVEPGAFVPRPSSELMVEWALKRLKGRKGRIAVDICTGAGPIALAIAHELPDARVWGVDIADHGLAQGRSNAVALGIDNVTFSKGDMYGSLPEGIRGQVDVVTGHVPYVSSEELDDLPTEVRDHEPIYTLSDESADGLTLMRRAVFEANPWLKPKGWLLLEVAEDLAPSIEEMCIEAGLTHVGTVDDDDALSVVVEGRHPG
jgi:release factor glutamine methyltransferase